MAKVRGDIMIKRDYYLNRLIHNMWNGEIKVITGIRRFCEYALNISRYADWP